MPLSKARMRELSQQRRDAINRMTYPMRQTHDKPVIEKLDKPNQPIIDAISPSVHREGYGKVTIVQAAEPDTLKQEKIAKLRELIANPDALQSISSPIEEESNTIPRYNSKVHKQGDRVIKDGKEVIVQEVDASGEIIPEYY